jgi:DNA-binding NarL/FixJ family response regulator
MAKVLVVDDHAVVRAGLTQILADARDEFVVGEASTGDEALQRLQGGHWDLVVLDISLPDRSGLDVLKQIKSLYPDLPVLVLTMHAEQQYAVRVLRAGASGFLTKQSAPEELMTAIRRIARGAKYLNPALAEKIAFDVIDTDAPLHQSLSDREFQVLHLLTSGMSITEIARNLCISVKTISTHRTRILKKMQMKTNAEMIQYALRNGLVP